MLPFRTRLFWKAFLTVASGVMVWFALFYWLAVPRIDQIGQEAEEKVARATLANAMQAAGESQRQFDVWRQTVVDGYRRDMKNVLSVVEPWANHLDAQVQAGRLSRAQAQRDLIEKVREIRYGDGAGIWLVDYQARVLSHPDKAFQDRSLASLRDAKGNAPFATLLDDARRAGEAYFSFRWGNRDNCRTAGKLGYVRNLPAWDMVVGTDMCLRDVEQATGSRKEAALAALRQHLRSLHSASPGGQGEVLVFDSAGNILIHPDTRLEGSSLDRQIDAATGESLGKELMEAMQRPDRRLAFTLRATGEGTPARGETIAWVDYFPAFDWYVAATARAELADNGGNLRSHLLWIFGLGLLVVAGAVLFFIRTVTGPLEQLVDAARRHVGGDLSATANIYRDDEIGALAHAFNCMVARLKAQVHDLERRVTLRTQELAKWANRLENRVAHQTAEARKSAAKFRGLLEQSLAGIFVVQDNGFRYVNLRFAEILGYTAPADIIGQLSLDQLVAPEGIESVAALRHRFLEEGSKRGEICVTGLCRDGERVELEVSASLIDYEGKPAIIGVALDITERKKIQASLESHQADLEQMVATRTAQLEAANQQLQAFTYAASHDLKAPLRGIQSFATLLEQKYGDRLDGDGKFFLHRIQGSARRMNQLVEDLLAHAKIEQQAPDIERVDLLDMVRSALAERQDEIARRGAEVYLTVPPVEVLADRPGLAQALRNLLENALKYVPADSYPIIEIGGEEQGGMFRLWVRDNGVGFEMMYHDQIFEIFRRLHTYDEFPGTGVGLALVKKAMERMGGTVWAESSPGKGSTFSLALLRETA